MATPLTDAINALTTYANEVTGESDTNLSDAVYSLASGYGGGGETTYVNIVPEQTVTVSTSGTQITNNTDVLIDGETYVLTIDGESKTVQAAAQYGGIICWYTDNQLSFETYNNKMYFGVYDSSLYGEHTIKVDHVVEGSGGGVSITDGMVITEWDTAGTRPKAVEIYGNVPIYMFGYYNNASSLGINLTSVTFHNTERIGFGAFQKVRLSSITIPDSVNSIGEQCFRGQTALAHYVHENARDLYGYNKPAVKALQYGLSHLEDMQLGAVGKPVTAIYKDAFSNNQAPSTAVFTIYTTGDNVNMILAAMRTYLTTQQIVFKASEATTYNGTSYAAGDTIIT